MSGPPYEACFARASDIEFPHFKKKRGKTKSYMYNNYYEYNYGNTELDITSFGLGGRVFARV